MSNHFILNDGTIVYMGIWWNVVWVSVDVNGLRKPNKLGKDLFLFYPNSDGIILPMGAKGTYYDLIGHHDPKTHCNDGSSTYSLFGATCTALRLLQ